MSFNIRYGTADDGDNHWAKRRELVFDVFRTHQPDVLGVQEALRFQLDEIRAALPYYGEIGVGRDDGRTAGEYSAILYRKDRFKVLEQGTFWLSETPEVPGSKSWGAACPRICTWATLKHTPSGRAFHICNVHLDHVSQEARARSVEQLLKHIRECEGLPVIVTGDFNAGEDNPAITALKAQGWVDTYRALHPSTTGVGTYHGWSGITVTAKVDYIFVPPNVAVLEAEILHGNLAGRYPSDHFPVMAKVKIGER